MAILHTIVSFWTLCIGAKVKRVYRPAFYKIGERKLVLKNKTIHLVIMVPTIWQTRVLTFTSLAADLLVPKGIQTMWAVIFADSLTFVLGHIIVKRGSFRRTFNDPGDKTTRLRDRDRDVRHVTTS